MRVSAAFPNPHGVLRPGQYGRVTVNTRTLEGALLVPQRAVAEAQGGAQVRIVSPQGTVQIRPVQMGPRIGARWVVERGLQAGERVIVDAGQLAEGLKVSTTPFVEADTAGATPAGASPGAPAPQSPAPPTPRAPAAVAPAASGAAATTGSR